MKWQGGLWTLLIWVWLCLIKKWEPVPPIHYIAHFGDKPAVQRPLEGSLKTRFATYLKQPNTYIPIHFDWIRVRLYGDFLYANTCLTSYISIYIYYTHVCVFSISNYMYTIPIYIYILCIHASLHPTSRKKKHFETGLWDGRMYSTYDKTLQCGNCQRYRCYIHFTSSTYDDMTT